MDVGGFLTAALMGAAVCRGEATRAVLLLSVVGNCYAKKINKENNHRSKSYEILIHLFFAPCKEFFPELSTIAYVAYGCVYVVRCEIF